MLSSTPCLLPNLTPIHVAKDLGDLRSCSHSVFYIIILSFLHSALLLNACYVSGPGATFVQDGIKLGIAPALRSEWFRRMVIVTIC